jgi:hypothetical protein
VVQQGVTYLEGIWLVELILGPSEKSQGAHHGLVLGGNQGAKTVTSSYYEQFGQLFNHWLFVDDRLR